MKKNIRTILVILFLVFLALGIYISVRGNYLEYKELGDSFISVYRTNAKYKYSIMGINFIIFYIIMYITNKGIRKGLSSFFKEEKKDMPKLPNKSISLFVSAIVSIIISNMLTSKIILFASNVSFNEAEPIFGLDISFFMFVEPLLKFMIKYLIWLFIGLIIYEAIYYIIVLNKFFDGVDKETLRNSYLIKHVIRYLRKISISFAIYSIIGIFDIVFDNFITTGSGLELIGAGSTNVTIKIAANIIFALIIVFSVFKGTIDWKNRKNSKVVKDILIIPAYLVVMFIVMVGFDLVFVNPNEFDNERKYIESNIYNTKIAYGIDCEDETIQYSGTIDEDEIIENQNIINNTAYISKDIILQNLKENQTETGYYTYNTANISNYNINGKNSLLYVSPKEISNNQRTYNSKTYEYTHGFGLIYTSATSAKEDGNIKYVDLDDVKSPRIYYGMETQSIAIMQPDKNIEYDYTDNKGREYTNSYDGNSGLVLNLKDRLILGLKKGNPKIAFSGNVTNKSRILINRNIIERAKVALPDVIYDKNPYTVVDEKGDIYWVLDAYTISDKYPYSTYTTIEYNGEKKKINYIRNSIKVIINSYNGEMKFYITDRTDPIVMGYRNIYPELFEDLDSNIKISISEKIVYPSFLYNIQATMIQEYHNIKPDVLYRSDNTWKKAIYNTTQNNKSLGTELKAYYTMINQDNTEKLGLVQMYTPKDKQSLTSYLVGTIKDGQNKLKIYKMSSDTSILGPIQLDTQIYQDNTIKKEIDNLNVTGAKVTKSMVIVPINNTLLYVEPIYQTMINESDVPILKKVIVASGNKVAIGDNFKQALENLASQYATSIETITTEDVGGIIQSIIKSNNNLSDSLKSNNWELIGSDIKKLQELIEMLEKQTDSKNTEVKDNELDENTVEENITE